MDFDLQDVFSVFLIESDECVTSMETALLQLEQHPDDGSLVDQVFRGAHTIKGNSSSLGFGELSAFAHEMEELLDGLRTHALRVEGHLITVLLHATDAIRNWIPRLRIGEENPIPADAQPVFELLRSTSLPSAESAGQLSGTGADASIVADVKPEQATMRVQTSRMDVLLNSMGELAIAAERVRARARSLEGASREVIEAVEDFERLLRDVHENVMRSRMVALGPTLRRHRRSVRDLASAHGKQVRLDLYGEDVEVDVSVIEALSDPLLHIIRNAIDHGIETPEQRVAAGKRPHGTVSIRAFHERSSIVLQVSDDGGGIRRDRVRERAAALGRNVDQLSEDDVLALIFEPGFSTADTVSETSGRGVGMDVVRRNVERVRGRVTIDSREGEGTTLTLRLPLTLAVIPGFVVASGGELFVIPLSEVDECLSIPPSKESGVMYVRGEAVPYVRLRDYFGFGGDAPGPEVSVVLEHNSGRAAFVVDEVIGESQIVIKPLVSMLRNLPGVSGTAVMASGSVALVLESASIFKEMQRATAA